MKDQLHYNHLITDKRSEGEEFIELFLEDMGIKYEIEVTLTLKGDNKKYRRADFYLPKYKVYIEYCGLWNNTKEDRQRYQEKMRLYSANKVPCIFLFPDNLGTLDYTFHSRLIKVLKQYSMKTELFKYNLKVFREDYGGAFGWLALAVVVLFMTNYQKEPETNIYYIGGCSLVILYQTYFLRKGYKEIFISKPYNRSFPSNKDKSYN